MTIARSPHPLFAALWFAWLVNVFVALAQPDHPAYGLVVLLAFFAIEGPATAFRFGGNSRDTLSEIATWVVRHTSKHKRFARGWNAALLGLVIVPIAFLLGRTVNHYAETSILGPVMAGLCIVFLWDHFTDPVTHG